MGQPLDLWEPTQIIVLVCSLVAPEWHRNFTKQGCLSDELAQEFYEVGLPVWFIRQTQKIAESTGCSPGPNVLRLISPRNPVNSVILADYNLPFPVIYVGHTNVAQKYACIHAYSRTWLVYQDAFSEEHQQDTENPEDPFYATGKPATSSLTVPISDLMRESLPRCEMHLFLCKSSKQLPATQPDRSATRSAIPMSKPMRGHLPGCT